MGYAAKLGASLKPELKIVTLGTASSYNIKNSYPKIYANLTTNNFFYRIASGSKSSTGAGSIYGNTTYAWFTAPSISYNKSTGVLSCGNGTAYANAYYDGSTTSTASRSCTTTKYMYYV